MDVDNSWDTEVVASTPLEAIAIALKINVKKVSYIGSDKDNGVYFDRYQAGNSVVTIQSDLD